MRLSRSLTMVSLPVLVLLSACSSGGESAASVQTIEPGSLKVCLYPGFAPFASQQDGNWVGWDVEYLQSFADDLGLTMQPVKAPEFNDIWMRPGDGECDVAGTGITMLASRIGQTGPDTGWSTKYYNVARSFAVRNGTPLEGIEDLAGKTVIVTKNSTADIDLTSRLTKAGIVDTKIEYTNNEADAAKRVAEAGPDGPYAYGGGAGSIEALQKEIPGIQTKWIHCLMLPDGTISSEPFGFAVRAESTGVLEALNAFIEDSQNRYPGGPGSGVDCPSGD
jgi:polar amino acid transport system substrate-binding protein